MASEEQINNQKEFNDYVQESQEFLAETISQASQLADQIKFQIDQTKNKIGLDKQVLSLSQQNVNALTKLKVDYQDISNIDKDRVSILNQIQKNNNVIAAQSKNLSKEELKAAKAYVLKENSLKAQQDALSKLISEQEQLEKAIEAAEASKSDATILYDQLTALDEQQEFYRQSITDLNNIVTLEQQRLSPQAIAVGMLQDQNTLLEEGVGYLDEEADAVYTIAQAQGLWNSSLGAVEGILKKAGAGGAAIALGLERGKLEAEAMAEQLTNYGQDSGNFITNIGREFKVLGAGIKGTFKGMADSLKALSLGAILVGAFKKAFKLIGGGIVTKFIGDLKDQFMSGISYLKDQFFSLNSYIEDAKAGDAFNQRMSKATADIATNIGVSTKNARELVTQAGKVSASLGMMPEELAATTAELQKSFGTTQKFSDDTVKTMGQLTHLLGLSNEEAAEFVKLSQLSGQEASDTTLTYKTQIQALKERENIAISEKEIMQEIAKSSAAQQLTFRGSSKSLAEAAFHAKKMGLSLAQTEAIGGSLLDFESSIANEMEAELMLGRDLNLERARSAALEGDLATVAKEVAGQIGSAAEFGKMNVLQQEALAKSVGVSRDELANMLKTQELLAGTGFDDMNDAQAKFKKLLKETGSEEAALAKMKEMGASDALQAQLRQVSLEEKRALQQRAIEQAQGRLANAVNKVFDAFQKVEKSVKRLKAIVVDQMKPFFNEFGSLVGNGAGELENRLVPAAEKLGKFLNAIGLKVLEVIKNIDLDKAIGDVKTFFADVKEKATAIMDFFKNSTLGQLLSGGGAATALSIAPIAIKGLGKGLLQKGSKMNPMFVKQSDAGVFGDALDGALGKRNKGLLKGLKGLSKITGGKKTVVGRALRGAAAMAGKRGSIGSQVMKGAKGALGKVGGKVLGGLGKVGVKGLVKAIPGVGLIATAGMAAVDAFKGFQNAGEIFNKKVGESVSMGEKLAAGAASAVSGLTFGLLDTKKTAMAFKNAGSATKKFFKGMGSKIKENSKKFFNFAKDMGGNIKDKLGKGASFFFDKFGKQIKNVKNLFTGVFSGIFDYIKGTFDRIKNLATSVFSNVIEAFKNIFSGDFSGAFDNLKNIFSSIGTFFVDQFVAGFESIKGLLSSIGTYIADTFSNIFGGVGETIINAIKSPVNVLIGIINYLIDTLNDSLSFSITNPLSGKTYELGIDIPNIPELAEGGIVNDATLAVIGEAGPEAVIPLDKLSSTVNGTTESSPQNVDELKQELQELKQIMSGFVEQMGQVVNRPITVELNGNKVGQALGQDSYRIQ